MWPRGSLSGQDVCLSAADSSVGWPRGTQLHAKCARGFMQLATGPGSGMVGAARLGRGVDSARSPHATRAHCFCQKHLDKRLHRLFGGPLLFTSVRHCLVQAKHMASPPVECWKLLCATEWSLGAQAAPLTTHPARSHPWSSTPALVSSCCPAMEIQGWLPSSAQCEPVGNKVGGVLFVCFVLCF